MCALLLLLAGFGTARSADSPVSAAREPPIGHVFLILLENEPFARTFGPESPAPYLARVLAPAGALLRRYYAIGHSSLPNYVALISGQAPNPATQLDCPQYVDFRPVPPRFGPYGQALGAGCVYPWQVRTLADQLEATGRTWKGYMEDMGRDPRRESGTCGHSRLGATESLLEATPADAYAVKHDPFMYFHSIIDERARCAAHVVNLAQLAVDLQHLATTPQYVFITPNLCHDGHDAPCASGEAGGLAAADDFLRRWVPSILQSAAYQRDGLLIITFDEAAGSDAETVAACCGERPLLGTREPPGIAGPGGGRVGAVLLSRRIRPGTVSDVPYNHYSLLRSVERLFGLPLLGYAGAADLKAFGADVFAR